MNLHFRDSPTSERNETVSYIVSGYCLGSTDWVFLCSLTVASFLPN